MPDPRVQDPTRPRGPGVHYSDVPPTDEDELVRQVNALASAVYNVEQAIRAPKRELPLSGSTQANTNSSGNVTFPIIQAGAGLYLYIERLFVEAATFDASGAYTPAAPYSNASFWLGIFVSGNSNDVDQGQMVDFLPTTAGAQGIPDVADYFPPILVRSGEYLVCDVHTGPTSKRLSVRYQGYQVSAQGPNP